MYTKMPNYIPIYSDELKENWMSILSNLTGDSMEDHFYKMPEGCPIKPMPKYILIVPDKHKDKIEMLYLYIALAYNVAEQE